MTTTTIIPIRGRTESALFTRALVDLAAQGLRTHCSDAGTGGLWLSDHPAERREATKLCRHCPVIIECRTAADARDERWHVWGGRDYTRRPNHSKQRDRKKARRGPRFS